MVDVLLDWEDHGRFPTQGGPPAGKDASKEVHDGQVDLSAAESSNEGSSSGGGGGVNPPQTE